MKAPVKIYVTEKGLDTPLGPWIKVEGEPIKDTDTAYIRQDVLRIWAKNKIIMLKDINDQFAYARIDLLEELIDKINSL